MAQAKKRERKEDMERIVGASYTDEASRKQAGSWKPEAHVHVHKLITVDSDGIGGVSV